MAVIGAPITVIMNLSEPVTVIIEAYEPITVVTGQVASWSVTITGTMPASPSDGAL